jgi:hypothetical protein
MDKIYADASTVVVHLGEESPGSRILFDELAEVDRELLLRTRKRHIDRPHPSETVVQEIKNLIQRLWFRRVWILQEVCMDRPIYFMCGSAQATKEALVQCILGYKSQPVTHFPEACNMQRIALPNVQISLSTLIVESRRFLASDPRDKIFALRSLMLEQQHRAAMDPLIDYTLSVGQTFVNTSLFLLPAIGLRLLTAIRHPHDMAMPSWTPDFSQTSPLGELHWSLSEHESESIAGMLKSNVSDERPFEVIHRPTMQVGMPLLEVAGLRLGKIRRRSPVFSFRDVEDAKEQLYAIYNSLPNMRYSWSGITLPKNVGAFRKFDTELLAGGYSHRSVSGKSLTSLALSLCEPYILHRDLQRGLHVRDGPEQAFYDSMQQCRIVLMDDNRLAIAPDAACEGDVVCLLQSG